MNLTLTEHEAELLRSLLHDHVPELQREVARTERRDFRHMLVERLDLAERLVRQLGTSVS